MTRRLGWLRTAAYLGLGLGIAIGSSAVWARQGVVKTKDGRALEGDVNDSGEQVLINIRGIQTKIPRDTVASIDFFDDVEARYKDKLAKLPKNASAKDHLELARWLFDVKSYDLALKEIDSTRAIDANSADAATLEQTIMSQRRMERGRTNPATGTGTAPATGTKPPVDTKLPERHLLTPEDINIIRQMEWKKTDTVVPRATVPTEVRKRYVDMKALDAGAFAAMTQPQQAYVILSDADSTADMRKAIKLTTDPANLIDFRRTVQPLVINNCGTTGCHGGHTAGKFFLFNTTTERDDVAYTNFYILANYKQSFDDKVYQMIDRTYADRSILGEFALHPDAAELDHPPLKGQVYKPIAVNKSAPGYNAIITWMKNLVAGEPKYGITYDLPVSNPKSVKPPATPEKADPKPPAGGVVPAGGAAPGGVAPKAAPGGVAPLVPGTVPPK